MYHLFSCLHFPKAFELHNEIHFSSCSILYRTLGGGWGYFAFNQYGGDEWRVTFVSVQLNKRTVKLCNFWVFRKWFPNTNRSIYMLQNKILVPTNFNFEMIFSIWNHYKSNSHVRHLNDFGLLSTAYPVTVSIQLVQSNNLALQYCKTLSHAQA